MTSTTSTKLAPFADQVVIRPISEDNVSKGGIVLPDSAQSKPTRGEVVAVGPGKRATDTGARIELDVRLGQIVIYGKYAGTDVKVDDVELVILKEKDLLVAIEE